MGGDLPWNSQMLRALPQHMAVIVWSQGKSASSKSAHEAQTQQKTSPSHPAPLTRLFAFCWACSAACAPNTPSASQSIPAACKKHLYNSVPHQSSGGVLISERKNRALWGIMEVKVKPPVGKCKRCKGCTTTPRSVTGKPLLVHLSKLSYPNPRFKSIIRALCYPTHTEWGGRGSSHSCTWNHSCLLHCWQLQVHTAAFKVAFGDLGVTKPSLNRINCRKLQKYCCQDFQAET